jgi:FkbM family methyltransferase
MSSLQPASLPDAVGRIWAQITANSSDVGDMFERITQSFYSKVIRPGDTVVDGGAHTGRHTIPLARLVGADGLVVAFEPLPSAAEKLRRLLAESGLDRRVRLRADALAREPGRRDFFVVNNMPEFSGLRSRKYVGFVPDQTEVQVDVETIDSALKMSQCPGSLSFVKLDLESGEFRALQGAEQTLRAQESCCVFENGLESSADGDYSSDEFFGYFERIGYELYDILGCHVTEACWSHPGPWYFVTMPRTRSRELLPLLWASALEELLTAFWSAKQQIGPPPASFASQAGPGVPAVSGYVDRVEQSVRVSGWAGDLQTGRPTRSLVIAVDGTAIATVYPELPRGDVVAATGQAGFERSGFDVTVRTTGGQRVEVHAQAADGRFVKIGGTAGGLSVCQPCGALRQLGLFLRRSLKSSRFPRRLD